MCVCVTVRVCLSGVSTVRNRPYVGPDSVHPPQLAAARYQIGSTQKHCGGGLEAEQERRASSSLSVLSLNRPDSGSECPASVRDCSLPELRPELGPERRPNDLMTEEKTAFAIAGSKCVTLTSDTATATQHCTCLSAGAKHPCPLVAGCGIALSELHLAAFTAARSHAFPGTPARPPSAAPPGWRHHSGAFAYSISSTPLLPPPPDSRCTHRLLHNVFSAQELQRVLCAVDRSMSQFRTNCDQGAS